MFKPLFFIALLSPLLAIAEEGNLSVSAGLFNGLDSDYGYQVDVTRHSKPLSGLYDLSPIVGGMINTKGGYALSAGLEKEFKFSSPWVVSPSFSLAYYEKGDGKALGSHLQFKTGLSLDYSLAKGKSVGVSLYHLSNGGLSSKNPGEESLLVNYQF